MYFLSSGCFQIYLHVYLHVCKFQTTNIFRNWRYKPDHSAARITTLISLNFPWQPILQNFSPVLSDHLQKQRTFFSRWCIFLAQYVAFIAHDGRLWNCWVLCCRCRHWYAGCYLHTLIWHNFTLDITFTLTQNLQYPQLIPCSIIIAKDTNETFCKTFRTLLVFV